MPFSLSLGTIAERLSGELQGDPDQVVSSIATLDQAQSNNLSFFANKVYKSQLKNTSAGCVLISERDAGLCPGSKIVVPDPYLAYALASHWFEPEPESSVVRTASPNVHPTAVVDPSATLEANVCIGPYSVIGAHCVIGEDSRIGGHTSLGAGCTLGEATRLFDHVIFYPGVKAGNRVRVHSGAVIGAEGFGYAPTEQGWVRIAQLGGVILGDDVQVGACTTIDRGALSDTHIDQGVIIDNQVQIAHNCVIGAYTAIAGCVGIAGSAKIGRWCTLAGACGIAGHVELVDHVHIGMQAQVTKSIDQPGHYASGTGLWPAQRWRRLVAGWRRRL